MREKLNIKTMICEKCLRIFFAYHGLPCTLSQMQDQVNVDVAYCCSGEDPGHSD